MSTQVLGLPPVTIDVGRPMTASLQRVQHFATDSAEKVAHVGAALWHDERLAFSRNPLGTLALSH